MAIDPKLRPLVWERAASRCEYCQLPSDCDIFSFCIDHIIAQKHHGVTALENLALSCAVCNSFKLDNLSGIDPVTGAIVRLFHPRQNSWTDHFQWSGAELVGLTPEGRATIDVLKINLPSRVEHRELLIRAGKFHKV